MIRIHIDPKLRSVVNNIRLHWWMWARDNLQRKNHCHPDLPEVILNIARLEAERSAK